MEGLTTIHLGGKLGQLFGKRWDLAVSSPAEAIRAIDVNTKGKFRKYLSTEGGKKFYRLGVGRKDALIEKSEIRNRSGQSTIYISPAAKGANSGGGKLILGVLMIVAAIVAAPYTGGTSLSWIPAALGSVGASLVLGGAMQLLAPAPNFNQNSQGDSRGGGSNLFQGNASVVTQGGAVGLVYGRALVTPMPISISFDNEDQIKSDAAGTTEYDTTYDPETGITQYVPR